MSLERLRHRLTQAAREIRAAVSDLRAAEVVSGEDAAKEREQMKKLLVQLDGELSQAVDLAGRMVRRADEQPFGAQRPRYVGGPGRGEDRTGKAPADRLEMNDWKRNDWARNGRTTY